MSELHIRKAAVLGAGVMGAQIAAQLINAGVPCVLFDLPAKDGDKNGIVKKAVDGLRKLEPSPIATKGVADLIQAANYDEHLDMLGGCDLIIEAIAERMDWKLDLYKKIVPHLSDRTVIASNTSGLSITQLSEALPDALRKRFCGIHFFNPPRYMKLVEIIPTASSDAAMLDALETFLTTTVGKGVIRAKDTPNFIANRIGVASMLFTIHHTQAFGLGFDMVDQLTGPLIGRPKSATYRTADVVGLDTMAHVTKTMADTLPNDPWHAYFVVAPWLKALIDKGALGQKTKAGIYQKVGKEIHVLDPAAGGYRPSGAEAPEELTLILKKKNLAEQFAALKAHPSKEAQFLWACWRDVFHYAAHHLADIADNARDLDMAIRWGFGWKMGPLETWQAAGWKQVAQWIDEDIKAGKALGKTPLPAWVHQVEGVHAANGSYSASAKAIRGRSTLPVYKRQYFPETTLAEKADKGETIWQNNEGIRLWTLKPGDDIAILSFQSKFNSIGGPVLEGIQKALDIAEERFRGMVVWQGKAPFSVGANLADAVFALEAGMFDQFEMMVEYFQRTSMRIKYSPVPVVVALEGMCLGGGCEFQMHSAKVVACQESYVGLVEAGVGLLPAGGGCKEIALRASRASKEDMFPMLARMFQRVAMAQVAKSAQEAVEMEIMRASDRVMQNRDELLYVALAEARTLADAGYRAPIPPGGIAVAGDTGAATLKSAAVNMLAGGFISEHDFKIASAIAEVLCGGNVEPGTLVDEEWLLRLERKHFVELAKTEKTQARIKHTLDTGKPLRN